MVHFVNGLKRCDYILRLCVCEGGGVTCSLHAVPPVIVLQHRTQCYYYHVASRFVLEASYVVDAELVSCCTFNMVQLTQCSLYVSGQVSVMSYMGLSI